MEDKKMTHKTQAPIDPIDVKIKMLRQKISGVFLAKRHNVSKMTVSRAINGDQSAEWLLRKIDNSLNVLRDQSMKRAAAKLRSIDNSKHERVSNN